jgi:hypothetical protein
MSLHVISIQFHSIFSNWFWFFPLHSNCSIRFDFVTVYSRPFHPVQYHIISCHPIHFNFTQINSHPFHLLYAIPICSLAVHSIPGTLVHAFPPDFGAFRLICFDSVRFDRLLWPFQLDINGTKPSTRG